METFKLMKQSLFHPFDFFYDIQFNNRAKVRTALLLIALACSARLISLMLSGFAFRTREAFQISVPLEIAWIIIPWLTWSVANWAVSTIIDGEGKFKDILVSSSYVFLPYIILIIPISLISNVLTLKELSIYAGVMSFIYLWMLYMLILQVKIVHDFELGKTIGITLLTILAMIIIWFIVLLVFGLVSQSAQFLVDILKEIKYRS
ncbi:YIP1 family protein [Paenibacillus sp. sptzw28]|uniref:YIP1 family protein n=1 Tax=Paenibacillus sp. sptzw28 TaxID=715179 RepID=UPI001C6F0BA6|nr:YIP1 family protein [Paenibacillus sp. sptzw28]QYR21415.1 YIP1 family protein [Paenibacillus sp. sptzw28]